MQRTDLDAFQRLMCEVQEIYGHRPPSAAVLQHWVDALKDHPFHTVDSVLRNWIRTKAKPPVIADISTVCAGMFSDKVEQRAAADKRAFGQEPDWGGVTPYGKECIRRMKAMVANPKKPNKEWARKIMENPNSTWVQRSIAGPVYATMQRREPGQDEEEYTAPAREAEEITI